MVDMINVGVPQVLSRAAVQKAIQAGIETTIASITAGLAMDQISLLRALKEALQNDNPELAAALGLDYLRAIMEYIKNKSVPTLVFIDDLPTALDEPGPASVSATRDGGVPTQVNITFSEPPTGYVPEIYFDGVYLRDCLNAPVSGFMNDNIPNIAPGAHLIEVLFRRESDGALTLLGPIENSKILN